MAFMNDNEAWILAQHYGFCPLAGSKYEHGDCDETPLEWFMFAQTDDHTRIHMKYNPYELIEN